MSDLDAFRQEISRWLVENCPESQRQPARHVSDLMYGGKKSEHYPSKDAEIWLQRCAEKGLTMPQWEQKYGGGGYSAQEAKIIKKEMKALGCRQPLFGHGVWMLGPALYEALVEFDDPRLRAVVWESLEDAENPWRPAGARSRARARAWSWIATAP